jgi:glycerophosphoryl diester phosphodiesterase
MYCMHKENLSATKLITYSFRTIHASFWRILGFEVFYKLATVFLFIPFLQATFYQLLALGGYSNATNEELFAFFISKYGILFLMISLPLSMLFIFLEFSVIIIMAYYAHTDRKVKIRSALKKTISRSPIFISFCFPAFAFFLLFILPFMNVGFSSSLIPSIEIPRFITGEINKTFHWKIMYYALLAFLFYLNIRWLFAIPIMVLEGKAFRHAARKSAAIVKNHYWKLIKIVFVLLLFFLLLLGAATFIIACIAYVFEIYITAGSTIEVIVKSILAIIYANLLFIIGFITTPFFIMIVTRMYVQKAELNDITLDEHILDFLQTKQQKSFFKKHKYKLLFVYISGITFFLITFATTALIAPIYNKPLTIAHRGYINTGVENTIEAVQGAINTQADYAEIDILQAKDGELVVIHDTKLSRLANTNAYVYEKTTPELQALTLRQDGFTGKISTLDEMMKFAKGKIKLNIEVKLHGYEQEIVEKLMETIKRNNFENECIIQTLHYSLVPEIKQANPRLQVGYILYASAANLHALEGDFFVIEEYMVTKDLVHTAKELRKPLYVWTVNEYDSMYTFLKMGVDGIVTDDPPLVHETLSELIQEGTYFDPFTKVVETIEGYFDAVFQKSLIARDFFIFAHIKKTGE